MTAIVSTRLQCDYPRCPAWLERSENLPATRKAAAAAGWTRKPFGRKPRLAYDYCPAHPDGKASTS